MLQATDILQMTYLTFCQEHAGRRQCGAFTCEQGDAIDAPIAGLRGVEGKIASL